MLHLRGTHAVVFDRDRELLIPLLLLLLRTCCDERVFLESARGILIATNMMKPVVPQQQRQQSETSRAVGRNVYELHLSCTTGRMVQGHVFHHPPKARPRGAIRVDNRFSHKHGGRKSNAFEATSSKNSGSVLRNPAYKVAMSIRKIWTENSPSPCTKTTTVNFLLQLLIRDRACRAESLRCTVQ